MQQLLIEQDSNGIHLLNEDTEEVFVMFTPHGHRDDEPNPNAGKITDGSYQMVNQEKAKTTINEWIADCNLDDDEIKSLNQVFDL